MYLLVDECLSKGLVRVAEDLGHTAQLTKHVAELVEQASDREIASFAKSHGAIIVTVNAVDFTRLAGAGKGHPGMILMPSVLGKEAADLFRDVLPIAEEVFEADKNMFVEIDEDGTIRSFQLPDSA